MEGKQEEDEEKENQKFQERMVKEIRCITFKFDQDLQNLGRFTYSNIWAWFFNEISKKAMMYEERSKYVCYLLSETWGGGVGLNLKSTYYVCYTLSIGEVCLLDVKWNKLTYFKLYLVDKFHHI